ncbi:hypothetical protein P3T27_006547 [Kitasatospora sp. MAA19]|uniref:hypothetical protein n=1 Tax=Kitasatospora sp. MAA19 TaxID=3035090 RepID=UPI0024761462|nr:hypothetical protein [Kitasatospora sp. MAA19]MDH6709798.1 hypothetical protein [Kitasatospora sp. MAA19]
MAELWYTAAVLLALLLLAGWLSDVRANRRVRSGSAHEVTPEQIRYVSRRTEEDGR